MRRLLIGAIAVAVQLACLAGIGLLLRGRDSSALERIAVDVPVARTLMAFDGPGFRRKSRASTFEARTPGDSTRALDAIAPARANGTFQVGGARPWSPISFSLPGARASAGSDSSGVVGYNGAYPGVDVIVARDPRHLRIAYSIAEPSTVSELRIRFADDGSILAAEPGSGAAVLRSREGRARLRVDRPVAFDAKGRTRVGTYRVEGRDLVLAIELADLAAPVFVDPTFYIPYWTILDDGRQPGAKTYDLLRMSRETQLTYDASTLRPVLLRPIRSQQSEDTVANFGTMAEGLPRAQLEPRVPGSQGPVLGTQERDEWSRVHGAKSEMWIWASGRWNLSSATSLPGLIDPAVAFDPTRGRLMAFGGGPPAFQCSQPFGSGNLIEAECRLSSSFGWDSTYEFVEGDWTERRIPGSPPPRLRGALAQFRSQMLLFGGRGLHDESAFLVSATGSGRAPDNAAAELLNDTWLFDGAIWKRVLTGNPPPPQEGAQLVFDTRRQTAVLIGGSAGNRSLETGTVPTDDFGIWEFDGTDWMQRFAPNSDSLPLALRYRRGVAAVWHPVRQTVVLLGGLVEMLPPCPYSIAGVRSLQDDAAADPAIHAQYAPQGCIQGYAHDAWEWNGSELRQLTRAAYSTSIGSMAIYRQVAENPGAPEIPGTGAGSQTSKLWPWRHDPRPEHFRLRTALERSYTSPGSSAPPGSEPGTTDTLPVPAPTEPFVSPIFLPLARPQAVFDPETQSMFLVSAEEGRVFTTDLATWQEITPTASPFAEGINHFFAATWNSVEGGVLLFEPRDGTTWRHTTAQGWARTAASPIPPWSVCDAVGCGSDRPLSHGGFQSSSNDGIASNAAKMPRLAFDRARGVAVLFHNGQLWESGGGDWEGRITPSALTACAVSTVAAYDGQRQRTVFTGCAVPAQTWEWDGSQWFGPFASPFDATVFRDNSSAQITSWQGPLQVPFMHPNALAESPALGGVALLDVDGTLRVWNGSSWSSGPKVAEGYLTRTAEVILDDPFAQGVPHRPGFLVEWGAPLAPFPPLVEDTNSNRLMALRDDVTGARQLDLAAVPTLGPWKALPLGFTENDPADASLPYPRLHPHPFELLSPERIVQVARSDPARKLTQGGTPAPTGIDKTLVTLLWPFRLLRNPTDGHVMVLTHRGALWELGGEPVRGIGDSCTTLADCGEGVACVEGLCSAGNLGDRCLTRSDCGSQAAGCFDGVCCNNGRCDGPCTTCNGTSPGICEAVPAGQPDPWGQCGSGECAPTCPGSGTVPPPTGTFTPAACVYTRGGQACGPGGGCEDGQIVPRGQCSSISNTCLPPPAPVACAGALDCADEQTCKTACSNRMDCSSRYAKCNAAGTACVPDAASIAATAAGIQPSTWEPEVERTPAQMAAVLRQMGFEEDEQGRLYDPNLALGGVAIAYDPNLHTPVTGLQRCLQRIQACRYETTGQLSECVAAMPRCSSSTPWIGDPAGWDCCPEACLVTYFGELSGGSNGAALQTVIEGDCYPGVSEMVGNGGEQ